ncbi:carbon-nitrogen hydrolase family protein [Streptomyces sp. URMC 123]|uniref:carbon-nitrogen hydrolase family protein n=1 Tax=Streptomyces sp. URMC 123 TaxID=3423403 RepID=UPI003F1CA414
MIVAAAQMTCRPGDPEANAATMAELIAEAAGRGAELVVFPELALSGYEPDAIRADPGRLAVASAEDEALAPVVAACRAAGVAAVVNCAARAADGALTITSFVIGPDGRALTRYDKNHVTETESRVFTPGRGDGRFTYRGVRFALAICFDAHFPELTARAAADGCEVFLASSLYGRGNGEREREEIFPALAKRHGMFVLLANHVGPAGAYEGCGLSAVWSPDGTVLAEAAASAVIVTTLRPPGGFARRPRCGSSAT